MAGQKKEWSLTFSIGARLQSSYPATFKAAEQKLALLKKASKNAGAAWKDFGVKAGTLTKQVSLLSVAAAGGAFALSKGAASAAGDIEAISRASGLSARALQEYQHAAERSGVATETFDNAVTNARAGLTKWASSRTDPLEKFRLSSKKIAALGPEKSLERLADYYRQMKDPVQKAALAQQLFGQEAGPGMQKFLEMGSAGIRKYRAEFQKTQGGFSDPELASAKKFNEALGAMQKRILGVRNKVGGALMPTFTTLFDKVGGAIERNMPAIQAFADKTATAIERNLPHLDKFATKVYGIGSAIWSAVTKIKDFVGGWDNLAIAAGILWVLPTAIAGVKAVIATAIIAQKAWTIATMIFTGASNASAVALKFVAAACAANPVGALIVGIMAAVAAVKLLYDKCETFRNVVDAVLGFVSEKWNAFTAWFTKKIGLIPKIFSGAWDAVTNGVGALVSTVLDKFKPLTDFISGIGSKLSAIFGGKKTLSVDVQTTGGLPDLSGHADGGIFTKPHIARFAEKGAEAAIPIENTPRALGLWTRTGEMAGFLNRGASVQAMAGAVTTTDGGGQADTAPTRGEGGVRGGMSFNPVFSPVMAGTSAGSKSAPITLNLTVNGGDTTADTLRAIENAGKALLEQVRGEMARTALDAFNNRESRQRRLSYAN